MGHLPAVQFTFEMSEINKLVSQGFKRGSVFLLLTRQGARFITNARSLTIAFSMVLEVGPH